MQFAKIRAPIFQTTILSLREQRLNECGSKPKPTKKVLGRSLYEGYWGGMHLTLIGGNMDWIMLVLILVSGPNVTQTHSHQFVKFTSEQLCQDAATHFRDGIAALSRG
jgi:hypothetical protein